MATVSFKKPSAPTPKAKAPTETPIEQRVADDTRHAAIVKAGTLEVDRPMPKPSTQFEGEFNSRDVAVPYLTIGQKTGTMTADREDLIGQFVYDKKVALGKEVEVIFCHLRKYYEEVTEFGSEIIPQKFDTIAEAKSKQVEVRDVGELDVLLVVEAGSEMEDSARLSFEGKDYVPARWIVRSTAYGKVVKVIVGDSTRWLKGDIASGSYIAKVEKIVGQKNSWYAPSLTANGKIDPKLREKLAELGI